jgi:hypothetical protein
MPGLRGVTDIGGRINLPIAVHSDTGAYIRSMDCLTRSGSRKKWDAIDLLVSTATETFKYDGLLASGFRR